MTRDEHAGQQRPGVPRGGRAAVSHMPAKGEDEQQAAHVLYVAAKLTKQRLVIGADGQGRFNERILSSRD